MNASVAPRKIGLAALIAFAVIGGSLAVGAQPAQAAFGDNCGVYPSTPWTNGVTVYSRSRTDCDNSGPGATGAGAGAEYHQLWWNARGSVQYTYSGAVASLTRNSSANCNGTGTFSYRTKGVGINGKNEQMTRYSGEASLTC